MFFFNYFYLSNSLYVNNKFIIDKMKILTGYSKGVHLVKQN